MKTRALAIGVFPLLFALGIQEAIAGECISRPEHFELRSDTVHWSFEVRGGLECLQGLRGRTMLLDDVSLVAPPSAGAVTISGPSFRYKAPSGPANDSFKISITGQNRRQHGTSVIVVDVAVR